MIEIEEAPAAGAGDEIKPYKVHVSSKYLHLTRQKLELTRLPHEGAQPHSRDWWEPKSQIEPLIDFWLEKYSWRDQESSMNKTPQFRTAISIPASETPLKLHFIHASSPHSHALPLLLIPPFPLSNLALVHLVKLFTEPQDASNNQPFHLVIPALPGLGFSDPFPNNTPPITTTAEVLNSLMARLGYEHYLVTNSGAAQSSPAEIDWKLVDCFSRQYSASCLGAHFISPPLASPRLVESPLEWARWTIASVFNAGVLGYSEEDFSALKQASASSGHRKRALIPDKLGLNNIGLREPNTLAQVAPGTFDVLYQLSPKAVGDSPVKFKLTAKQFTPEQIITFTNLAWLPGPEHAMRFWALCATHNEGNGNANKARTAKPKVAITVFLGKKDEDTGDARVTQEEAAGPIRLASPMKVEAGSGYACPAWGNAHYSVLFSQRVAGKPGLLAWERPEVILAGIRGLAKEILKVDKRLQPVSEMPTIPLEHVATPKATTAQAGGLQPPARPTLEQGDSSRTRVGSQPPSSPKGKEAEAAPAETVDAQKAKTDDGKISVREGTPDTIILVAPPKDDVAK